MINYENPKRNPREEEADQSKIKSRLSKLTYENNNAYILDYMKTET